MGLSLVRNESVYQIIKQVHEEQQFPISIMCKVANVSRAAYYKWLHRGISPSEMENQRIAVIIKEIHRESPDKGYRRIRDELERYHSIKVNDKRVLRICRKLHIKSAIKSAGNRCHSSNNCPKYTAENILKRNFAADKPNEKWLTDVTEFQYYIGGEKHKIYLSAILDLYDHRIVSYVIRDHNDNALVYDTLDEALAREPSVHPILHSDRGFQYTSYGYRQKLMDAGMTQSMSRVGNCIDNGPMEGFWGILKRERYYGKKYTNRNMIVKMIDDYIDYYNNKRLQRKLGILTPMEKYEYYKQAA